VLGVFSTPSSALNLQVYTLQQDNSNSKMELGATTQAHLQPLQLLLLLILLQLLPQQAAQQAMIIRKGTSQAGGS